jgi:hypothetical protein
VGGWFWPGESVYPRWVTITLRGVAVAGVLGTLGLAFLATRGPARAARRQSPSAAARPSTDQTRTDELLRLNANLASDPALATAYQAVNAQYFEHRLPEVRIRWEPRLEEIGPLIAEGFRLEGTTDGQVILLNPALQDDDRQFRRALCHEIVHVAVRGERDPHGPEFQRWLRQLSADGAFTGIIATEEEKVDLRRRVDALAAELEQAATHLRHQRAELDADNAHPPADADGRLALQARAADYNRRVQQHNDAVAELNRLSERYNLMVSYPDGLDRERVQRREAMGEAR